MRILRHVELVDFGLEAMEFSEGGFDFLAVRDDGGLLVIGLGLLLPGFGGRGEFGVTASAHIILLQKRNVYHLMDSVFCLMSRLTNSSLLMMPSPFLSYCMNIFFNSS